MSESRRATLMPFGGGGGDAATADAKKRRTEPLSVRLTFDLPETTESTCPIYNYKEELAAAKKRDKSKQQNGKTTNGLDPFDEEDDDVKRIAMEMEAKYGTGPPAKKKRKNRRDDYADIGMGYDESDSFIDNTDGYDEIIPQNVTTLHGGFYINCGALEFKADEGVSSGLSSNSSSSSSSSEDEEDEQESNTHSKKDAKPVNRKRILESSESEGENEADKTDKPEKANLEKKQKTSNVTNGLQPKKKKEASLDESKKIHDSLKDKQVVKKVVSGSATNGDESGKKKFTKDLKKDEVSSVSVELVQPIAADNKHKNVIELVASTDKIQTTDNKSDTTVKPDKPEKFTVPSVGVNERVNDNKQKDVQLPANLPTNISDLIRRIKDNVQNNKDNSKDIFNGNVNNLLITFERKSKVLGKQSRSKIYQHLSSLMQTEKENLCKRAKSLVMAEDTKKLNSVLTDLKEAVRKAMIPLWEAYTRVVNSKTTETEENKNQRMPKRKFTWTEETRKMLREIIIIKKRLLIYEGKTKESIEIHLNLFIKSDVHVIWPDGWMTMAALFKMCSSFEKKPPNPTNQELNSSSEAVLPSPSAPTAQTQGQNLKLKKKDVPKVLSTKELQKFQSNSVSITPVVDSALVAGNIQQKSKVLKVNNDLGTKVDVLPVISAFESRGLNISPITPPVAHKSTIQARNVYKPEKQVTPPPVGDRTTKFVNLAKESVSLTSSTSSTDLSSALTKKMSTDYNIDSIMNTSRKSDISTSSKRISDIIIPKEEVDDGSVVSSGSGTKIPLENFMPKPMVVDQNVKVEDEEDVIILDDTIDEVQGKEQEQRTPFGQAVMKNRDKERDGFSSSNSSSSLSSEFRRKPGPKSKTKYVDTALMKTAKSASMTSTTVTSSSDKKSLKSDTPKEKKDVKNDGDDILKLMENLKELNKMTTPSKSVETSPASAVSVIAFNKNFAKSPTTASSTTVGTAATKLDGSKLTGLTFNDVYQRHFMNNRTTTSNPSATPPPAINTTNAKSYNSSAQSSSGAATGDKHFNSNNNYTTAPGQQATKYKNNYQQHTGTYNLMDDMLANFITEYAYPKTANHKQKPTQK